MRSVQHLGSQLAKSVSTALMGLRDLEKAAFAERFFRTGPGEYGEGDRFLGLSVPQVRAVTQSFAKEFHALPQDQQIAAWKNLLESPWHEVRLSALVLPRLRSPEQSRTWSRVYLSALKENQINNWDLVDVSAQYYLGQAWVDCGWDAARKQFCTLAQSRRLWERRAAIVATFAWLRARPHALDPTLEMADLLVRNAPGYVEGKEHDLIHKAVGWLLREVGKRDLARLRRFLEGHARSMPRTALRYAIEKLPPPERARWMADGALQSRSSKTPMRPVRTRTPKRGS